MASAARPALSASRAIDVFDVFAAFPGRDFTMSEIMRATGINVASCHAILAALTERGYLTKRGKAYRIGRPLVALGQAARASHPLVGRAQAAAEELNAELGVAVLLSTTAGGDILALTSLPGPEGRSARLLPGQRVPLVPPNGAHFVAWSDTEQIEGWIARSQSNDPDEIEAWRRSLAITRRRGYQVTLRRALTPAFGDLLASMAKGTQPLGYHSDAEDVADHGWTLEQPDTIEADTIYNVALIAAPIFDESGEAVLSLALGGMGEATSGSEISRLAERRVATGLQVMREDRGA